MGHALSHKAATEALERAQASQARHRKEMNELKAALVRKSVEALAAAGYGMAARMGVPMQVKGFPVKLGVLAVTTLVEVFGKGMVQRTAGAISDCSLVLYTEAAVRQGTLVAGESDGGELG